MGADVVRVSNLAANYQNSVFGADGVGDATPAVSPPGLPHQRPFNSHMASGSEENTVTDYEQRQKRPNNAALLERFFFFKTRT